METIRPFMRERIAGLRRYFIPATLTVGVCCSLSIGALLFWFQPSSGTLADFVCTRSFRIPEIPANLSGITYCPESKTLFLISNCPTRIYEITPGGRLIRQIELVGFNDTEDIVFIEQQAFAVIEEKRGTVVIFQIFPETEAVQYADCRHVSVLPPDKGNTGLEGLSWDPVSRNFLVAHENSPRAIFTVPYSGIGNAARVRYEVPGLHNLPWIKLGNYSGIYFERTGRRLLILSRKSHKIKEFSLDGREKGSLNLSLFIPEPVQTEGLAFAPEGELYVCSEPDRVYVFSKVRRERKGGDLFAGPVQRLDGAGSVRR